MTVLNEADEHLLRLIADGDEDGWRQFVQRFQGRLLAFASRQVGSADSADDLVQETFVAFLRAMHSYRRDCELESFLFQILRRRIVDHFRRQGKRRELPVCGFAAGDDASPIDNAPSPEPPQSDREELDFATAGLSFAISQLAGRLRELRKFRDLKIAEGVFFAGRGNQEIATLISATPNEIAVVKRRMIQRLSDHLRRYVDDQENDLSSTPLATDLLSQVWQNQRPSCPKRSTLGKYTLGILPDDWTSFVAFHVEQLGCTFCQANLDELALDDAQAPSKDDRLFQSTIGFFRSNV